jgi:hypothetical protein
VGPPSKCRGCSCPSREGGPRERRLRRSAGCRSGPAPETWSPRAVRQPSHPSSSKRRRHRYSVWRVIPKSRQVIATLPLASSVAHQGQPVPHLAVQLLISHDGLLRLARVRLMMNSFQPVQLPSPLGTAEHAGPASSPGSEWIESVSRPCEWAPAAARWDPAIRPRRHQARVSSQAPAWWCSNPIEAHMFPIAPGEWAASHGYPVTGGSPTPSLRPASRRILARRSQCL